MTEEIKPFRPWRKGFVGGGSMICIGSLSLIYAANTPPIAPTPVLASIALIAAGGLWFRSALRRWSGKNVEQRSIKSLSLPEGWIVTPNYAIKGAGDVDLLIESPDGNRFAVEIKSIVDVMVKPGFLFITKPYLSRENGKKLSDDPIPQTTSNAAAVDAIPVLWCPKARTRKATKLKGVIVVLGGPNSLKKSIGAKRRLFGF